MTHARSVLLMMAALSVTAGCEKVLEANATGYTETTLETSDGQEMPVSIWYPGVVEEGESADFADYDFATSADAMVEIEMATGPFPIVLMSHGNGGGRNASAAVSEAFARAGYIVAAPDHTGNTFSDGFGGLDTFIEVFFRRPDDLLRVHDFVADESADEESLFAGHFSGTVAVAGHSTGGSTALLSAGGGVTKSTVLLGCAAGQVSGLACEIANETETDLIYADVDGFPEVAAMFVMAPLSGSLLEGDALEDVDAPTLVMVGDRDNVTPLERDARPIFESLKPPSGLAVLEGAGHYGFATLCDVPGLQAVSDDAYTECTDPSYIDADVLVSAAVDMGIAWFDTQVKASEDAADIELVADDYAELTLEVKKGL